MREILCGDIGGTNANLCLVTLPSLKRDMIASNAISLKEKKRASTKEQPDFSTLIVHYLEETKSKAEAGCFAVAGPVKEGRVEMTNTRLIIDVKEILAKTPLKKVLLINDFEALGYATNVLLPEDVKQLNPWCAPSLKENSTRAILGAGTGLGKATLLYDPAIHTYRPLPSEGGHGDLPLQNAHELNFVQGFTQEFTQGLQHPTYEDLLSGRGLEFMYKRLQQTQYLKEPKELHAQEISKTRSSNPCCEEVFKWFITFYARCARNFALDLLAQGGIFLGGGIGAANPDIFEHHFMEEFTRHPLPLFQDILKNIPVTLITNYDVSLKGAAFAFFSRTFSDVVA